MQLEYLVDRTEALPTLARWHYAEWGHYSEERTVETMGERLRGHLHRDRIPLTVVAHEGDVPIGTAALVEVDMETRRDLTPWLADVVVSSERRGSGIGTRVVEFIVERARELGVRRLYLFTPDRESFYARMGWSVLERTEYRGEPVVVMQIDLA
jgi:N-acetylglutamate synthase-like GNAT family acetyltransferase